jgi:hypothetical protein
MIVKMHNTKNGTELDSNEWKLEDLL